ncbi:hypothetical protein WJX72_006307 [[Myrmecia] bisecta]|uniref:Uncharacterized protein n=1 Tax=[Myrmecia] bisecta TaxID=41462 RepID=A0AAW1P960_9CHLO
MQRVVHDLPLALLTGTPDPASQWVSHRRQISTAAASPSASAAPAPAEPADEPHTPANSNRPRASRRSESRQGSVTESSSAAAPTTSGSSGRSRERSGSLRSEALRDRQEICDKLISVFVARKPEEWRKLIAFSKQWPTLSNSLFARIEQRSKTEADDGAKLEMKRLLRRLKSVHEELQQYNALLAKFRKAPSYDWEGIVARQRDVLQPDFFKHMENLIHAANEDPQEQEALAELATKVLSLIEAYDRVARDQEAMAEAATTFEDILQVNSLAEMDAKVDELAASGRLDPALLLTMAKAYNSTKDTDVTREEVKDIMAHLYFKAKETFAQQQPPEVRILKHLLSLDDPKERFESLAQAFTPGPEIATEKEDYLSTNPQAMLTTISAVLQAYDSQIGSNSMLSDSSSMMNPEVIQRMRGLQEHIQKQFT